MFRSVILPYADGRLLSIFYVSYLLKNSCCRGFKNILCRTFRVATVASHNHSNYLFYNLRSNSIDALQFDAKLVIIVQILLFV